MATVTIKLEVADQHCADIMCTALEGGIGYWSQCRRIKQVPAPTPSYAGEENYLSCELAELNDDESGYDWEHPRKLTYATIRRGIQRLMLNPKYAHLAKGILEDLVGDQMGCNIDANVADVIVQFGLFNEERYA